MSDGNAPPVPSGDEHDMNATTRMAEGLASAGAPSSPAAPPAPTVVPAQLRCGAYRTTCRLCGAPVWSIVVASARGSTRLRSARYPTRDLVQDDASPHSAVCTARTSGVQR